MLRTALLSTLATGSLAWDVARTPPMGFNTASAMLLPSLQAALAVAAAAAAAALRAALDPPPLTRRLRPLRQWNLYHCAVDATILTETATAMDKTGLRAAGYIFVNRCCACGVLRGGGGAAAAWCCRVMLLRGAACAAAGAAAAADGTAAAAAARLPTLPAAADATRCCRPCPLLPR